MQERESIRNRQSARSYSATLFDEIEEREQQQQEQRQTEKQPTKKDRILNLYFAGTTDIEKLSQKVGSRPSYVAEVLHRAGLVEGYYDLYTTTGREQNIYSKFFSNILSFKSPEAARRSVERINNLYRYFESIGDRAGQHHAQVIALTGRNRARWSGKMEEAQIFSDWLLKT
jgi:hypothetical protein